jgi:hypothetical protein
MRIFSHPLRSEADVFMIVSKQTNLKLITQDKRLYREEDTEDERGRKRRLAEFQKAYDEEQDKKFLQFLESV